MEGLCFRCLREGHFQRDCTNDIVCIRCGLEGHGSRGCKRPRSPSSEVELRRLAIAMVACRLAGGQPREDSALPPPPPPPPPAPVAAPANPWPRLAVPRPLPTAPRLALLLDTAMDLADLCVVRRSHAMEDLERRLHQAMVVYAAGARRDLPPEFFLEVLSVKEGISSEFVSIHHYRPKYYIIVFARREHRNRVSEMPVFEHRGVRLFFRPWNRQSQAVHAAFQFRVKLVLEGIPPHAWERNIVESMLGSSCLVDALEPETSSRSDLSAFKLSAWTAQPADIPSIRWLAIPEPGLQSPWTEPSLLQYKVLMHLDEVRDYRGVDEPLFLRESSDSGQSGVPEHDDDMDRGGGSIALSRPAWQFGVH
uniref:CCHC-type domain-containing protein n=1 Tax=Aegilops tauschii subsp. strangulata TaxID=200361 RepID=A0A453R041_AEGTS